MKIAIFHNLTSGGAKRSLYEIVRRICDRNQIDIYTLQTANHDFCDIRPYVNSHKIYPFQPGKLFHSPFGRLNALIRTLDLVKLRELGKFIAKDIEQNKPDLVFFEPCQFENAPSVLRYIHDLPTVFYCHEPYRILYEEQPPRPYYKNKSAFRRVADSIDPFLFLYNKLLRKNDFQNIRHAGSVFVNSNYTKKQVERIYGIEAIVSYLGVDTDKFHPLANVQKSTFILSVGSLTPLKGFDFIIRSLALLPPDKRVPLVISSNFTNDEELNFLTDLAKTKNVQVYFMSNISDDKLVELYNSATLTAYTPYREPFGLVALESMACATPVVGVREGGLLETVQDQVTGRLVERNESIFSHSIMDLLQNPLKAREYGNKSLQDVKEKWSWSASIQKIQENFEKAVPNRT